MHTRLFGALFQINRLTSHHRLTGLMETYKKISAVYHVKAEFLAELCQELGELNVVEDLVFSPIKKLDVCFAQDIWLEPQIITFQSITDAVKILRQVGAFWYLHPIYKVRRSRLIEEQLRQYPALTSHFPINTEIPSIGSFGLLDQNTLIYSSQRLKKWPDGKCFFIEDKTNPPNRAYTLIKKWIASGTKQSN